MKFRKRMKPVIKSIEEFNWLPFEAIDWYHSKLIAEKKANEYRANGFLAKVIFEDWWSGYFVYIRTIKE